MRCCSLDSVADAIVYWSIEWIIGLMFVKYFSRIINFINILIEKHFKFSRDGNGPHKCLSLNRLTYASFIMVSVIYIIMYAYFYIDFSLASADFSEHQMGHLVKLAC